MKWFGSLETSSVASAEGEALIMSIESFSGEYRWLSNFWPAPIVYRGMRFLTTEHAYQALKSGDPDEQRAIARLPTPGKAKKAGTRIRCPDPNFDKLTVMLEINRLKYEIPELREKLLETGDLEIIEGNTWGDVFWGVCDGAGENHLGCILMQIRTEIAGEPQAS
jgi:N-glycosidase YbiA